MFHAKQDSPSAKLCFTQSRVVFQQNYVSHKAGQSFSKIMFHAKQDSLSAKLCFKQSRQVFQPSYISPEGLKFEIRATILENDMIGQGKIDTL